MTNVLIIGATGTIGEAVRETLLRETDDTLTLFSKDAGELNIDKTREKRFRVILKMKMNLLKRW